ncbi:MAG: hypothetical protein P8P74_16130 [Crocinitomicaceae bacterium]|nr:hypothetical protein [Crocinitomicaceae bacterium]
MAIIKPFPFVDKLEFKMKLKHLILVAAVILSSGVSAFEGIIHCTKTQNGVVTNFDFYVKGNQIAVVSSDPTGSYKILLNRSAGQLKLCMDVPEFDQKGYYMYTAGSVEKNDSLTILKQVQTDAIEIDGVMCEGYTVVTDNGSAVAYFGPEDVNLTGFSDYFNDPVYELLDALNSSKLPRKLVVNKNTGSYTIDLVAEAQTLDASIFEVPAGYDQFQVTAE